MGGNIPLMDEEGQRLYLTSMLSSPELFARVNNLVTPKYFDKDIAKGIEFIQNYFAAHRSIPALPVFAAATKLNVDTYQLGRSDIEYVSEQIAEYCKFKACIQVIQEATGQGGYFEKGDLATMVAKMKAATEIGLQQDLGIDYFDDPLSRLESADQEAPVIPTMWAGVDELIGGGVGRQELILFLAPSGGGKSVGMINLAYNFMMQGLHGVYISLEMRDKKVAGRADQILSRMTSNMVNLNRAQTANEISKFHEKTGSKFWIKRMRESTTSANDIIAYLRQLESSHAFKPDYIVVDYLDIMAPSGRSYGDSIFLKEKAIAEEVRAIGFDFDAIMVSASQLEKHATEKINNGEKMNQSNIQGGSSKTNTADLMIALARSDAMMQAGEVRFEFPKARNSDANQKQVTMKWDNKTLRISDFDTSELDFRKKGSTTGASSVLKNTRSTLSMERVVPGSKAAGLDDLVNTYQ